MCLICFLSGIFGLPHVSLFIYELLINTFDNYFLINKNIIFLEEIFHPQICIHLGTRYEKSNNSNGPPGRSPCTLQTNFVVITSIMPQCIVIFHCPHVSVIISNRFSSIGLEYLPINHTSFFLLTLWHSKN